MKAPEKIRIVSRTKGPNGLFGTWTTRTCKGDVYISLEALMKWLKEQRDEAGSRDDHFEDPNAIAAYDAYQTVMDHLTEYEN